MVSNLIYQSIKSTRVNAITKCTALIYMNKIVILSIDVIIANDARRDAPRRASVIEPLLSAAQLSFALPAVLAECILSTSDATKQKELR